MSDPSSTTMPTQWEVEEQEHQQVRNIFGIVVFVFVAIFFAIAVYIQGKQEKKEEKNNESEKEKKLLSNDEEENEISGRNKSTQKEEEREGICEEEITSSAEFHADALNTERRFVLHLRAESENNNNKLCVAFSIFNVAHVVSSFCPLPPFELKGELLEAMKKYLLEGKVLSKGDRYALSRVTNVGDNFLRDTRVIKTHGSGVKTIDLTPLFNVTAVGNHFLFGCSDLKTIDLSPLSKLTTVGVDFLAKCSGLNTIDLTPLSKLTTVGKSIGRIDDYGFLSRCSDTVQAQGKKFLSRRGRK